MCAQSHYYGPWKNGPIPWAQTCLRTCASFTHSFRSRSMAVAKMLGWLPITSSTSQPRLSPELKGRCLLLLPEQNALILGWFSYLDAFFFTCSRYVLITTTLKCGMKSRHAGKQINVVVFPNGALCCQKHLEGGPRRVEDFKYSPYTSIPHSNELVRGQEQFIWMAAHSLWVVYLT